MNKISLLPNLLISQIAAGEVIERPASIVKELVENAIDAGSTNISIRIENGGIDYIGIQDNGCGINEQNLPFALMRHATSKISNLDDLDNVDTLGFRGEALAAISAIAHVTLKSKTIEQDYGLSVEARELEKYLSESQIHLIQNNPQLLSDVLSPVSMEKGSHIEVSDIFFRTPARRKFLKNATTEWGHCLDIIKKMALLNPNIHFEVMHNGKAAHIFPICSIQERVAHFVGKNFMQNAIVCEQHMQNYRLLAFLASPLVATERVQIQHSIVNKRFVKDKIIAHALKFAYQDILHGHKQAQYLIYLDVPHNEIDVNVHPCKSEIRFKNTQAIHQFLYQAIKPELTYSIQKKQNILEEENIQKVENVEGLDSLTGVEDTKKQHDFEQLEFVSTESGFAARAFQMNSYRNSNQQSIIKSYNTNNFSSNDALHNEKLNNNNSLNKTKNVNIYNNSNNTPTLSADLNQINVNIDKNTEQNEYFLGYALAQLHGIYILAQNQQGLVLVDMHAAHERVIYEQLKQQIQTQDVAIQYLLLPHIVHIDEIRIQKLRAQQEKLILLGFNHIIIEDKLELHINSLPKLLDRGRINTLIENIIEDMLHFDDLNIEEHTNSIYQDKILSTMACHKAVRANDNLSMHEMNALLRLIEQTESGHLCNHGRPTYKILPLNALDNLFMRGQ